MSDQQTVSGAVEQVTDQREYQFRRMLVRARAEHAEHVRQGTLQICLYCCVIGMREMF